MCLTHKQQDMFDKFTHAAQSVLANARALAAYKAAVGIEEPPAEMQEERKIDEGAPRRPFAHVCANVYGTTSDTDCPICYEKITEDAGVLAQCSACKNFVHRYSRTLLEKYSNRSNSAGSASSFGASALAPRVRMLPVLCAGRRYTI
jgi:hypothetical protein